MSIEVIMPQMGETVLEGTVNTWHKSACAEQVAKASRRRSAPTGWHPYPRPGQRDADRDPRRRGGNGARVYRAGRHRR